MLMFVFFNFINLTVGVTRLNNFFRRKGLLLMTYITIEDINTVLSSVMVFGGLTKYLGVLNFPRPQ